MQPKNYTVMSIGNRSKLARQIAQSLQLNWIDLFQEPYADGEFSIGEIKKVSVNENVLIIASSSTQADVSQIYVKLCIVASQLRRAGAKKVVCFMPYASFARQPPIFRHILSMLHTNGVDHLITVDIHDTKLVNHRLTNVLPTKQITKAISAISDDLVVVAPDNGAYERAQRLALYIDRPLVVMRKQRLRNSVVCSLNQQLHGRPVLVVDDIVSTGKTLQAAQKCLKQKGAGDITVAVSHLVATQSQAILKTMNTRSVFSNSTAQSSNAEIDCADIFMDFLASPDAQRIFAQ